MLAGADEFLYNLLAYRVCWIRGRLGGGKTLLAVAIAQELMRRGYARGVISNFPTCLPSHDWRRQLDDGTAAGVRGSVVIFDEAGLFLDRRSFMKNDRAVGALLRKLDCVLLLPSVTPPDSRLSYFSVQRVVANAVTGTWTYRWALAIPGAPPEVGEFRLTTPQRLFGTYDTRYIPVDDGGYARLWRATVSSLGAAALLDNLETATDDSAEDDAEEARPARAGARRKKKKAPRETLEALITSDARMPYENLVYHREQSAANDTDAAARDVARAMIAKALVATLVTVPVLIYAPAHTIAWLSATTGGGRLVGWQFVPPPLPPLPAVIMYAVALLLVAAFGLPRRHQRRPARAEPGAEVGVGDRRVRLASGEPARRSVAEGVAPRAGDATPTPPLDAPAEAPAR